MARIREKHLRTIEDIEIDQHNRQHCTTDSDGKQVPARPGSECKKKKGKLTRAKEAITERGFKKSSRIV